jgi:hypothetical protein
MSATIIVIAVIATIILVIFLIRNIPLWLLLVRTLKESKERERKAQEEYEEHRQFEEKYKKEREAKIANMITKGYEEVSGLRGEPSELWIRRQDGHIIALYDLNEKRVPLAELAESTYTQVIGNIPEIWYGVGYKKDHLSSRELSQDDWEVRKINHDL